MDVSVIIINYNTLSMTRQCIDSVFEKTKDLTYEVILVDNASNDGSKAHFENDRRILYIYNIENLGFGKANNIGVNYAKGRNIIFLNSDTMLRNNAIKILSDYLDANKNVGVCGGNLYSAENKPIHSFHRWFPSLIEDVDVLLHRIPTKIMYRDGYGFNKTKCVFDVAYITGADLMIKKTVFDNVGGFDEDFFMYYEDAELCFRVKSSGFQVCSVPTAEIVHLVNGSSKIKGNANSVWKKRIIKESRMIFNNKLKRGRYYNIIDTLLRSSIIKKMFLNF